MTRSLSRETPAEVEGTRTTEATLKLTTITMSGDVIADITIDPMLTVQQLRQRLEEVAPLTASGTRYALLHDGKSLDDGMILCQCLENSGEVTAVIASVCEGSYCLKLNHMGSRRTSVVTLTLAADGSATCEVKWVGEHDTRKIEAPVGEWQLPGPSLEFEGTSKLTPPQPNMLGAQVVNVLEYKFRLTLQLRQKGNDLEIVTVGQGEFAAHLSLQTHTAEKVFGTPGQFYRRGPPEQVVGYMV